MSDRIAVFSNGRIEQVGTPGPRSTSAPPPSSSRASSASSNIIEREGRGSPVRPEKIRMLATAAPDAREPRCGPGCGLPRHGHALRGRLDGGETFRCCAEPRDVLRERSRGTGAPSPAPLAGRRTCLRSKGGSRSELRTGWGPSWRLAVGSRRQLRPADRPADVDRQRRGAAQPRRVGGLHPAAVGEAVHQGDRLQGERQVRRLVGRDGHAHAPGRRQPVRHGLRLRRRQPAPDPRRRRPAG